MPMDTTDTRTPLVIVGGQLTILIALTALMVLGEAWQIYRGVSVQRQQWEYAIESPADEQFRARMEVLGGAGWEIVSARRATSDVDGKAVASYEMIMRRPKDDLALPLPSPPPASNQK